MVTHVLLNRQFSKSLNMDILAVVSLQFQYSVTQDRSGNLDKDGLTLKPLIAEIIVLY